MKVEEVLLNYDARLHQLEAGLVQGRIHGTWIAVATAAIIALFLIFGLYAIRQQISFWWLSLAAPLAIASIRRYGRHRESQYKTWRLQQFYQRATDRVKGTRIRGAADGEEFADPAHVYSRDLNVFGEGSLFELLCTARTANGRRGLAAYLLTAPPVDETLLRQEAVRELRGRTDLREQIALLGKFEFLESSWETFSEWLDSPAFSFARPIQTAAFVSSAAMAVLVVGGLVGLISWIGVGMWLIPLIAFHSVVGLVFRTRVQRMLGWLGPVSTETQVLRDGLRLLEATPFHSVKLAQLAGQVGSGFNSVRKLERLLHALEERDKPWFSGFSLLLLGGTQLCMAVEDWRIEHREPLRIWLDAWAEFEALSALANYSYENPGNVFPEFCGDDVSFEAVALGHPLLQDEACVRNDVRLNREHRFYLVSGSNMSGKSTLLRAIGLNAVLAFAGAPVRARSLRLSRLSVCASLSVVDSLLNGKSKFRAEVDRLRQTLEAASEHVPVLFLIDEIFSGTNSRDRRVAAEAIVRTLMDRRAIGGLSTHDLALCEIAVLEGLHGSNAHTGSRAGGGPMDFDYVLKPGVTNESNALAIARMAGVPV